MAEGGGDKGRILNSRKPDVAAAAKHSVRLVAVAALYFFFDVMKQFVRLGVLFRVRGKEVAKRGITKRGKHSRNPVAQSRGSYAAYNSAVNTPTVETDGNRSAAMAGATEAEMKAERLKSARKQAGFKTAGGAAEAFGWNPSAYRHHENGTRDYDVAAAKKYARAFRVEAGYLLGLDVSAGENAGSTAWVNEVEVIGVVQAGIWREQSELPKAERYTIKVGPPPFPQAQRFALRLEGVSMDKTIQPGSDLECVRVMAGVIEPKHNDIVIVERQSHELVETTCKRLIARGADWELVGESSDASFNRPLKVGSTELHVVTDDEVRIIAIVVAAHLNLFQR